MTHPGCLARGLVLCGLAGSIVALSATPARALGGHKGGRVVVSGPTYQSATPPMLVPSNEPYYAPPSTPMPQAVAPTMTYTHAPRAYQPTGYYAAPATSGYTQRVATQPFRPIRMFVPRRNVRY